MGIYIHRDNQQMGPFEEDEIRRKLADGALSPNDLGWDPVASAWTPLGLLLEPPAPAAGAGLPPPPPSAAGAAPALPAGGGLVCQVCQRGTMVRKKKYRMSAPVVVIGYILLIPSILGMLAGCLLLSATGSGSGGTFDSIRAEARAEMVAAGVPPAVIETVMSSEPVAAEDMTALTAEQRAAVRSAQSSLTAGMAGAGFGVFLVGGMSFVILVSAFVGGLLGWLLVMKKRVLECGYCGAVIAAS